MSLARAMFSLGSFVGQGMEEIPFLNGNPHSLAFNHTSSSKYSLKCILVLHILGTQKAFSEAGRSFLSELSIYESSWPID